MKFQTETYKAIAKVSPQTIAGGSMKLGMRGNEPLLLGMDGMIRYAKAYKLRYDQPISEDYALRDYFLSVITGLRRLLDGDGAVAMERGISTDSKDNGVIEEMFWAAMDIGGFKEEDI
ncbi:MAG: hypothetical protein M0R49_08575 [Limnochordia bacterium]|nr:hypothetical protein [Limnochordia bacterium]